MAVLDIYERVDLYTDYLNNGGIRTIPFIHLLEDLKKVKKLPDGITVDINTISPIVNAAMLAYEATQMSGPPLSEKFLGEYETLFQKSGFFRQTNIETKEDFDKIFEEFKGKKDTLFRGLSEAKYRLYSTLQRSWITNKIHEKEKCYGVFVREMIENAKNANGGVLKAYLENTGLGHENDIGILSFLQHYGCPTPLLDWTYNFAVALFFATHKNDSPRTGRKINNYFCVYYLEEEHLKGSSLNDLVLHGLTDKEQNIKDKATEEIYNSFRLRGFTDEQIKLSLGNDLDRLIISQFGQGTLNFITRIEHIIKSPILYFSDSKAKPSLRYCLQNNMNIVNQEGAFTWNADPITPLEQIANEQYRTDDDTVNYKFSKCININKTLIPHVQEKIYGLGVTENFIYPNPQDVAKSAFQNTFKN